MLNKKLAPPKKWPLLTGFAAGQNSKNFFLFGYSPDYNEYVARRNPPTEEYTHILHFRDLKQHRVCRIPDKLSKMWWNQVDSVYAVGAPEEMVEIRHSGCTGVAMEGLTGVFTAIWGTGEDHIFACGMFNTFILYRRLGIWQQLPLPEGMNLALHHIVGFNERDVYFVGQNGVVLHFDGSNLQSLEIPTTRTLLSASLFDHKNLCISGYGGTLLFGNKEGWRLIPAETEEPILSIALFRKNICFPTEEGVWAFDGKRAPTLLLDQPAGWVNSLGDAITLSDEISTWLFNGEKLIKLDTILSESVL
jgi:hypothetical protein